MMIIRNILILITVMISTSFTANQSLSLTIKVTGLKNSNGQVQYSLYNKDGSIPDDKFINYYKQQSSPIFNKSSTLTFTNLPKGVYAVNVLHDENKDGEIDKGWFLPVEGIGFSNLEKITPLNRPNFKKTKFNLEFDKQIEVKVIYL